MDRRSFTLDVATAAPADVDWTVTVIVPLPDCPSIVFGLNAQKGYVSLYVGDAKKIDPEGGLLKGLSVGKGCIRFTRSNRIAATGIREFIERTAAMARRGEDVDC